MRSRKRISLSPKISTRPARRYSSKPGEREAGLLDVRQRDAALEAGGAGQQIEVEAGRGAARAEQGSDGHAARHDQASGSISPK